MTNTDAPWILKPSTGRDDPIVGLDFASDHDVGGFARAHYFNTSHDRAWTEDEWPNYLHWNVYDMDERSKSTLRDLGQVRGGVIALTPRMHDLFCQFKMGSNQFVPMDIYEYDQVTQRPETLVLLNIRERRALMVPEESTGISPGPDGTPWIPDKFIIPDITVSADALDGIDLWADPTLHSFFFVSSRLMAEIRRRRFRIRGWEMKQCQIQSGPISG